MWGLFAILINMLMPWDLKKSKCHADAVGLLYAHCPLQHTIQRNTMEFQSGGGVPPLRKLSNEIPDNVNYVINFMNDHTVAGNHCKNCCTLVAV